MERANVTLTISVVMATYNGEKNIVELLDSLKRQTVQPNEVLIADDGSTDHTVGMVEEYISKNALTNWRICVNKKNKGWRRNFIEAANQASGDLIFFCDQDDIWMEHKLQMMSDAMAKNANIDVLAGQYIKFFDTMTDEVKCEVRNNGIHRVELDKRLITNELPGCVYCVRRTFWERVSKHWNGTLAHDRLAWAPAKQLGTLYILEMPVIYWRRHDESATTISHRRMKTNKFRLEALEMEYKDLKCLEEIMDDLGGK